MIRTPRTILSAAIALIAVAFVAAAPAAAAPRFLSGGMKIRSAKGSSCSISFTDPLNPVLIYTAGHCYDGSRDVFAEGRHIGRYRPDLVYSKKLDLVAIQLDAGVSGVYSLCFPDGCHPIGESRMPKMNDFVCKWGAVSGETCGPVRGVWDHDFAMRLPVRHGDSGAPIYQLDPDGTAHLFGVVDSLQIDNPDIAYGTMISPITALLAGTWGSDWRLG
jgi:hypothetical protein